MKWLGTFIVLFLSSIIIYYTYSLNPHINNKTAISIILKNEKASSLFFSENSNEQVFEFFNTKDIKQDLLNQIFIGFLRDINEVRGGRLLKYTNNRFIAEFSWYEASIKDYLKIKVEFLYDPKLKMYTLENVEFTNKTKPCANEFIKSYFVEET